MIMSEKNNEDIKNAKYDNFFKALELNNQEFYTPKLTV